MPLPAVAPVAPAVVDGAGRQVAGNDEPSLPLPAVANGDQQAPTGTSIQEGLASAMVTASEPSGGSKSASGGDGWSLSDSDFRDPEIVQLENTIACDPSPPPLPRPGVDAAPARSAHDDWIHLDPSLPSFKMPECRYCYRDAPKKCQFCNKRNICFVHPKLLVNIVAVEGDEHPVMTACWDCHRQVLKYLHSFCIPMDIDLQIDHEYLSLGGQI